MLTRSLCDVARALRPSVPPPLLLFLRVSLHLRPSQCCAIDWMVHTMTGFNALLNNADDFPNRYTISPKSARHFGEMSRRLYRVFAHAFYHHREAFNEIEVRTLARTLARAQRRRITPRARQGGLQTSSAQAQSGVGSLFFG